MQIKTENKISDREKAIYYWNYIIKNTDLQIELGLKYFSNRNGFPITGREIEAIWKKEIEITLQKIKVGDYVKKHNHNKISKILEISKEDGSIIVDSGSDSDSESESEPEILKFGEYFFYFKNIGDNESNNLLYLIEHCKGYIENSIVLFNINNNTHLKPNDIKILL